MRSPAAAVDTALEGTEAVAEGTVLGTEAVGEGTAPGTALAVAGTVAAEGRESTAAAPVGRQEG